jgi:hypothetical protein
VNRRDAKALANIVVCFLIEGQQGVGWGAMSDWPDDDIRRFEEALDELAQQLYNRGGDRGAALFRTLWIKEGVAA